jgi:integrase
MPLYKQPGSDMWWVSISHPDHPRVRRSTGTTDRKEAQRIHDELKAQLWAQAPLKGRTWGQAVLLWASAPGRSQSDILSMAKFGRHYPDRALSNVTAENLLAALAFCKTPSTYMRYRGRITAILNCARRAKWLREIPELPTKRVKAKPREWLTHEEWDRLFVRLPTHQRQMAKFAIETGLRQDNVLGLEWSRVDLERRMVWVEAEDMKGAKPISIPLSEGALDVLKARVGIDKVWVFTYRGRPIQEVKTAFRRACVEAGVPHFTWHGLRHTWATWHAQAGTPLDVLQKLGGWADLRMVLVYAHHAPSHLASYADNTKRPTL